ncbi:MAG TPA: hypothetical protein VKT21_05605, partial [Thermoplasmata archaeon]|nr:hypothetical protein [Thermoplasmata archaeon]
NLSMFQLARTYSETGMLAYSDLQQQEFAAEAEGYRAVKHQAFAGTEYFDDVAQVLSGGLTTTLAMEGSTETEQFRPETRRAADTPPTGRNRRSATSPRST